MKKELKTLLDKGLKDISDFTELLALIKDYKLKHYSKKLAMLFTFLDPKNPKKEDFKKLDEDDQELFLIGCCLQVVFSQLYKTFCDSSDELKIEDFVKILFFEIDPVYIINPDQNSESLLIIDKNQEKKDLIETVIYILEKISDITCTLKVIENTLKFKHGKDFLKEKSVEEIQKLELDSNLLEVSKRLVFTKKDLLNYLTTVLTDSQKTIKELNSKIENES